MNTKSEQLNKRQKWSYIQRKQTKNGVFFNSTEATKQQRP